MITLPLTDCDRDLALAGLNDTLDEIVERAFHRSNPGYIHQRYPNCPYCAFWRNTEALRMEWAKITRQLDGLLAQDKED